MPVIFLLEDIAVHMRTANVNKHDVVKYRYCNPLIS